MSRESMSRESIVWLGSCTTCLICGTTNPSVTAQPHTCPPQPPQPPRVLCTGSRRFSDWEIVNDWLQPYPEGTTVIVGGAPGLDTIVEEIALRLHYEIHRIDALWSEYGKNAGPIRNQAMLDEGKPTEVLAFPLPDSRGTIDMLKRAYRAGLPIRVWYEDREIVDVSKWMMSLIAVDLREGLRLKFLSEHGREPFAFEEIEGIRKLTKGLKFASLYGALPQRILAHLGIETNP